MKEIDFLPEWYKSDRRRHFSYRTQYVALAGIVVVMLVWNFTATHSISKAKAELGKIDARQADPESFSAKLARIKDEVTNLRKKVRSIEEIDSKIDVASVLAELSFSIDKKVVLSKVQFIAEKFEDSQDGKPNSGSVVRVAGTNMSGKRALPLGDVRFKVVISGVAADASNVAALICKLEDSPYFCQVIPSFSRSKEINPVRNSRMDNRMQKESFKVSEFEISCYLANYREQ